MLDPEIIASQIGTKDSLYGPEYYRHHFGGVPYERNSHWLRFFGRVADEIIRRIRPRRVFDAGCGWGFLVEGFWDRGVEALGRDISTYAIRNARPDIRPYCSVGSLAEPIEGEYGLVTCIEVLEHMREDEARLAIQHMSQVTECILFSSTPNDFSEPTHINVRPLTYWLERFADCRFYPDVAFDASFISPHAFLVRKELKHTREDVFALFNEVLRHRGDRAAFLARHGRIEQLETEVETLKGGLADHFGELQAARASSAEMRATIRALSDECELLASNSEKLKTELQSVYDSPGWHLLLRYREWLQANSRRHAWVRAGLEPCMQWLLHLSNFQRNRMRSRLFSSRLGK